MLIVIKSFLLVLLRKKKRIIFYFILKNVWFLFFKILCIQRRSKNHMHFNASFYEIKFFFNSVLFLTVRSD